MEQLRALRDHWASAWILLSLPGLALSWSAASPDPAWDPLLHVSGELSARLLVLSLVLTPLLQLKPWAWVRWLLARRRWIGVASGGYALLHLAFYGLDRGVGPPWASPRSSQAGWPLCSSSP